MTSVPICGIISYTKGDVEMSIINLSELSYDEGLDKYEVMRKQMLQRGICESDIEHIIATLKKVRNEE